MDVVEASDTSRRALVVALLLPGEVAVLRGEVGLDACGGSGRTLARRRCSCLCWCEGMPLCGAEERVVCDPAELPVSVEGVLATVGCVLRVRAAALERVITGETGSSTSISTSPSLSELYILVFNVVLGVQG